MYQTLKKKKDFNVLISRKSFFHLPVKSEKEAHEKIVSISKNNNYTMGNLLDFASLILLIGFCLLIAINLSKQTKLKDSQQIRIIRTRCYSINNVGN